MGIKMAAKKKVVIGFAGAKMDKASSEWRPSFELFKHKDLAIDRFELLYGNKRYKNFAETLQKELKKKYPKLIVNTHLVKIRDPWKFEEVYTGLYDFSSNYPFDLEENDYLIHTTTGSHVIQICLYLFVASCHIPGRLIQVAPSQDKSKKKTSDYYIVDLELSKYDLITTLFYQEHQKNTEFLKDGIKTQNSEYNKLIEQLEYVAVRSVHPILILGATGVGKSKLAERIFELKKRGGQIEKKGKFISINCATLRGDTVRSVIFGHKKGAFTGAEKDHDGLLTRADKGLLFLDEIGELPLEVQADLLKAIEEKVFLPLGGKEDISSDFQLIAGTNTDIYEATKKGRFRKDLLSRIDLWPYKLPDLKDRPEDIEPNIEFELEEFSRENKNVKIQFNKDAKERFLKFAQQEADWQGNFRDLKKAIIRLCILAKKGRVTLSDVDAEMERLQQAWAGQSEELDSSAHFITEEM
ncbi:sigma 54-interacting transcriptional regulator, partial [bacterium]|nr:sigma 54-interacting transcriptional regulator [bacterium]